ncbi:hypothetical protein ACWGOE_01700 [Leucobacter chromiiresistens]
MARIVAHRTSVNHLGHEAEISRRIVAPTNFEYALDEETDTDHPAIVAMECSWNTKAMRYEVERLELVRRPEGEPVTSLMIRQIPVGEILALALNHVLTHLGRVRSNTVSGSFADAVHSFNEVKHALRESKLTDEKLEWVATLYEMSAALGNRPTQEVSSMFEVSLRTASNWVRQARDLGKLD